MYIYARYTRPASELNCLRFNFSELFILWQRTSCGNLQGNLFYDNPIQSMDSRWFQNLVIHLSITIWKFLNSETFYYAVDLINPTLTKRLTPDFESRFISFFYSARKFVYYSSSAFQFGVVSYWLSVPSFPGHSRLFIAWTLLLWGHLEATILKWEFSTRFLRFERLTSLGTYS